MRFLTPTEVENLESDIAGFLEQGDHMKMVETTFPELLSLKASTFCNSDDNTFEKVAAKYPNVRVVGAFGPDVDQEGRMVIGSCEILLPNTVEGAEMGEDISELVSQGNGSLRFDGSFCEEDLKEIWFYFECE